jgi:cysteinyl-tRNA synthetase, unknown class
MRILKIALILMVFAYVVIASEKAEIKPDALEKNKNNILLYWINSPNIDKIAQSDFKYVIMDYSKYGDKETEFTSEDIKRVRESLAGGRVVLCYLSIGEAENYRYYWKKNWKPDPEPPQWKGFPSFLGPENPGWEGNFIVNYSDHEWQKIIIGYLDKIIAQDFDGIYLDIVDGFYNFENEKYNETPSREDMEKFVIRISQYAKSKNPNFLIFVQNAEVLTFLADGTTPNTEYLNAVDGIGRECTFYQEGVRDSEGIEGITRYLDKFKSGGKIVFTIDYPPLDNKELIKWCQVQGKSRGYIPYIGPVELDRIFNQL